jgi:AraC-like DNA-binding protein
VKNVIAHRRTIYELDKSERQSEQHLAAIKQQRTVIIGLATTCTALLLVIALVVWNRRRLAMKNRNLYLKIQKQDKLAEELEDARKENRRLRIQSGITNNETSEKEQEDRIFEKLTELMKEKLLFTNSEIKRSDIAASVGVSDRGLHDCIKNNLNMSFMEYVNHLRLSYARELLLNPSEKLTIEAVATDAGFNTRMTFYRLFHKTYGLTPDEYKKSAKKKITTNRNVI